MVLGFDNLTDYYPENNETDFGASIGRYANRIKDGRINIDGTDYQLPRNNFGHCLHGGTRGWQYQFYEAAEQTENSLKLVRVSPDGDQGFPGNVTASVTFTLTLEDADATYEKNAVVKWDADKARQVTLDFTDYLRNNFSAIASENPVPFAYVR